METKEVLEKVESVANEVKSTANEAKSAAEKAEAKAIALQGQLDALEAKMNRQGKGEAGEPVKDAVMALFEAKADALRNRTTGEKVEIQLDKKAAVTMLSGAAVALRTESPNMLPYVPTPTNVEDVLAKGTIAGDLLTYVQESGFEGAPAMTGEGALKPKVSITLETKREAVKKIAAHFKVSEETTRDYVQFVDYLKSRVVAELKDVKQAQLIYGDGLNVNLQGIYPVATEFAYSGSPIEHVSNIDALRKAIAQVRKAKYNATAILMHPDDVADLELIKDENGNYVLPTILTGNMPNIGKIQIMDIDVMTPGTFLVGAFDKGAQYFTREGLTIRVYDQNEDDAIKNMVTVVVEERGVQAVYRPEAFVKGTFAAAKGLMSA
ncbi:phage major capsid protein [Hymenobacter aerilatus]|uniref:Phage major capsid protein n=1 Tax=Hymenobacter aerilatus TaxID=2932251 RepID=A0A8T9T044_9BACT|nr:phage major capsid protein [Hymenobacter aerilatus]UOR05860.1 phage major capsid protein [Hymenobacter aerilatus]